MIEKKYFGEADGREVSLYILKNVSLEVTLSDYGATIIRVRLALKNGEVRDLVRGYDDLASYMNADGYLGAVVGRVGNRICKGKFSLDGKEYELYCNNGVNHLHGGKIGFDKKIYDVAIDGDSILFSATSPEGEEGYPGTLKVTVTYTLTENSGMRINYRAVTDKRTIINLTNHAYFNLGGYASGSVLEHELTLDADAYLPINNKLIPTGELRAVKGTPFDFTAAKKLSKDQYADAADLNYAGGYDHCFCFTGGKTDAPVWRGNLYCAETGRSMDLYTDQPAVQVYAGNFLNPEEPAFKGGYKQAKRTFVCLETQHYPNSPNTEHFPSVVLSPDEVFDSTTEYRFSVK